MLTAPPLKSTLDPKKLTFLAVNPLVVAAPALAEGTAVGGYADAAVLTRVACLARVRRVGRYHVHSEALQQTNKQAHVYSLTLS